MKLEDVKKGDKFRIEYGYDIHKVRCINNDPIGRKIFLGFYTFFGLICFMRIVKDYDAYNFEKLDILNPEK